MTEMVCWFMGHDFVREWSFRRSARCTRCHRRARHVEAPWEMIRINMAASLVRDAEWEVLL